MKIKAPQNILPWGTIILLSCKRNLKTKLCCNMATIIGVQGINTFDACVEGK